LWHTQGHLSRAYDRPSTLIRMRCGRGLAVFSLAAPRQCRWRAQFATAHGCAEKSASARNGERVARLYTMKLQITATVGASRYSVKLDRPRDISIPLQFDGAHLSVFGAPQPRREPYATDR